MRILPALALALALAGLPAVAAQHDHHEASTGVMIGHDAPADGRAFVGNLAHFAVLDLGTTGDTTGCFPPGGVIPQCHQQNHVRVTLNGVVLLETTPDSGHDYDGVVLFDVTFPAPGNYTVQALDEKGSLLASFAGYVVDAAQQPGGAPAMKLKLDAPAAATAGLPETFTYETDDAAGAIVKHSDAWFEVRKGTDLAFRTKTHTHTEAQSLSYAFPLPGAYTVRVTSFVAFPSPKAQLFAPLVEERTVQVLPALDPSAPAMPTVQVPDRPLVSGFVADTHDAAHTLVGTYDPWTSVGPATQMHLTALAMDPATRMPIPHVDFTATLKDNLGRTLFASTTLHEYDGIYEWTAVEPVGLYTLAVQATQGAWSAHVDMPFTVTPPVMAAAVGVPPMPSAGAVLYDVSGLDGAQAGKTFQLSISDATLAGQPFPHSEVDYQVLAASGVPALAGKLHTHDDGRFQLGAALAQGSYTLRLSPFPLEADPTPLFYGKAVGDPLDIAFTVGAGPGFPVLPVQPAGGADAASHVAPGAGILVLVGLLGLALLRRRA
ncbi:MAG: hypothetical protein QOI63_675 [Thermoplasmata archaeon]|jgi:hypothetical protein|nr:hypothetical protein [Thermoplasmata archaeon]